MVAIMTKPGKATEKAKNAGLSLYPSEIELLRHGASRADGGNVAGYVRRVLLPHAAGEALPLDIDHDVLIKLARIYAGYFAPQFAASLAEHSADQPKLLHDLLFQMQEAFACGYTPAELVLVPRSELRAGHPWHKPPPVVYPERLADSDRRAAEPKTRHPGTPPAKSSAA